MRTVFLLLSSLVSLAPLAASAATDPNGGEVVVERRLASAPQDVVACVAKNSGRASYPSGVLPSNQFTSVEGSSAKLTQWFTNRTADWRTTFDVSPDGGGSIVRVVLPVGYSATAGYQRASVELIDYCQAHPAG